MKGLLIFDGDCGFCRRWIARWQQLTGTRVEYRPYQELESGRTTLPPSKLEEAVHYIAPDGSVYRGAHAVFQTLAQAPRRGWLLKLYKWVPGFAKVSEWVYNRVANNRIAASKVTRALYGDTLEPPKYTIATWAFTKALGLVYLGAFASFWVQAKGLVGSRGIIRSDLSDETLTAICASGVALSLVLLTGKLRSLTCLALWFLYLQVTRAGSVFFAFQWDILLLEAGFLAIFISPNHTFLMRWLLFRLMLGSGIVKLASQDPTWSGLTAMSYHFETQPLPTWIGYYAHQLPQWWHKVETAGTLFIELALPFLIFLPRRLKLGAFFSVAALQLGILLTGNYTYFNWLTIALALFLLDDDYLKRIWKRAAPVTESRVRDLTLIPMTLASVYFGAVLLTASHVSWPSFVYASYSWIAEYRTINGYGLFATMTTERNEIVLEGSNDGREWKEYEFKWKPGDVNKRPGFVAPHQPRLDWQMWFAALGSVRSNTWLLNLSERILEGVPEVLALLAKNPFPDKPPRFLRAQVYQYNFTTPEEKSRTGAWWKRGSAREYLPMISLRSAL